MQIPHSHPSQATLFNLVKVPHVFSHHANSKQVFSSIMQPYTSNNNRPPNWPNIWPNNLSPAAQPRQNHRNDHRPTTHQACPFQQQNSGTRPPFRTSSSNNTNQRCPPNNNNAARQNPSTSNAANSIVCNNCGRLGHFANWCITVNWWPQTSNNMQGGPPNRNTNNENAAPRHQHANFITDSTPSQSNAFHQQACMAFSYYQTTLHGPQTVTSWPDTNTPQIESNRALLRMIFPTTSQAPPKFGANVLYLWQSIECKVLEKGQLVKHLNQDSKESNSTTKRLTSFPCILIASARGSVYSPTHRRK